MQLTHLPLLLLATLTTSTPLLPRALITASTLIQDVTNIHNGVLANKAATSSYDGGSLLTTLVQGTPVLTTVGEIHLANRKGFADAKLAPQFGEEDTRAIFEHVVDTVGVSIPDDVDVLIAKKGAFEESGLVPVVVASLKLLINDHDTFSEAVTEKAYMGNETLTGLGEEVVDKIHDAIQRGIDVYTA